MTDCLLWYIQPVPVLHTTLAIADENLCSPICYVTAGRTHDVRTHLTTQPCLRTRNSQLQINLYGRQRWKVQERATCDFPV